MLSKVSDAAIQVTENNTITDSGKSFNRPGGQSIYDDFTFTNPYDNNLSASFSLSITADGQNYWIKLYSNNTLLKTYDNPPYPTYNISDNITIWANEELKIQYYGRGDYAYMQTKFTNRNITLSYTANVNVYKVVNTHTSLPRELKSIWEKGKATLYGMHIDNTRYTGEAE